MSKYIFFFLTLASALWGQPADPIAGEWNGILAGKLHLTVRVETAPDHMWHGKLQSPEQGNVKLEINRIVFDGRQAVRFELDEIKASYEAELNPATAEMTGIWQQSGARIPLTLRRPEPSPRRPKKR